MEILLEIADKSIVDDRDFLLSLPDPRYNSYNPFEDEVYHYLSGETLSNKIRMRHEAIHSWLMKNTVSGVYLLFQEALTVGLLLWVLPLLILLEDYSLPTLLEYLRTNVNNSAGLRDVCNQILSFERETKPLTFDLIAPQMEGAALSGQMTDEDIRTIAMDFKKDYTEVEEEYNKVLRKVIEEEHERGKIEPNIKKIATWHKQGLALSRILNAKFSRRVAPIVIYIVLNDFESWKRLDNVLSISNNEIPREARTDMEKCMEFITNYFEWEDPRKTCAKFKIELINKAIDGAKLLAGLPMPFNLIQEDSIDSHFMKILNLTRSIFPRMLNVCFFALLKDSTVIRLATTHQISNFEEYLKNQYASGLQKLGLNSVLPKNIYEETYLDFLIYKEMRNFKKQVLAKPLKEINCSEKNCQIYPKFEALCFLKIFDKTCPKHEDAIIETGH